MKKNVWMMFFQGLTVVMILLAAMPGYCRTLSEILDQGTLRIGMIAEKDYPFVFKDPKGSSVLTHEFFKRPHRRRCAHFFVAPEADYSLDFTLHS